MRNRIVGFTTALFLVGAVSAQAAPIAGTSTAGENGGFGLGFSFAPDSNLAIGQAFTMGASAQLLESATVWLNDFEGGFSNASFTFQIMDAVGASANATNVLYQTTALFPDTEGGHSPVTMSGIGLTLSASTTYYLVISTNAGQNAAGTSGHGWGQTTGPYVEPFATVGSAYVGIRSGGAVADYTDLQVNNGDRTLFLLESSTQVAVPEPTSLLLLGSGLLVVSRRLRRRG